MSRRGGEVAVAAASVISASVVSAVAAARPVLRRVLAGAVPAAFAVDLLAVADFAVRVRDVLGFAAGEPVVLDAVLTAEVLRAVDLAAVEFAVPVLAVPDSELPVFAAPVSAVPRFAAVLLEVPDDLDLAGFGGAGFDSEPPAASVPLAPPEPEESGGVAASCLVVRLPLPDFGEF